MQYSWTIASAIPLKDGESSPPYSLLGASQGGGTNRVKDGSKIVALAKVVNYGSVLRSEYQVAATFEIDLHDDDVGELFCVCDCAKHALAVG